jgi:hypothetical protein
MQIRLFLTFGAMFAASPPLLAQPAAQVVPSVCAKAERITRFDYELHNDCTYTVYWRVECVFGDPNCFGARNILVRAGNVLSTGITGDLYGPYR